jgi:arrestin-related trafficking adapter 1
MPAKLLNFVNRNAPNAAAAKKVFKNVTSKATSPSPLLHQQTHKPDVDGMDLLKRHSISLSRHGIRKSSHSVETPKPATLDIVAESPPLVSYNSESDSSGALFSGQLLVTVLEPSATFKSIEVQLFCSTSVKKAVVKDCVDCHSATTELKKWQFAPEPLTLTTGPHQFPISYLFTGKMPATTHAHLCMLDYHWAAVATTVEGETIKFSDTILLKRAIHPQQDKESVRVFPPTNIAANVTHNPIIYDTGDIPMSMRLTGITKTLDKASVRWRLRRLVWRIEEVEKIVSHACPKHASKVPEGEAGILHDNTRTIGEAEVNYQKTPWKTDIQAGEIDAEFTCNLNQNLKRPPVCDVDASGEPYGMSIAHHLVIELVMVEETAPLKRMNLASPTGAARILRSQFPLILTSRGGQGISWDEETPPVYQDVPPSPPSYRNETTECDSIDFAELGEDFEALHLGESLVNSAAAGSSSSVSSPAQSTASPGVLAGMSPRLAAAAMSPRLQARAARDRSTGRAPSASPIVRPSSSGSRPRTNLRLSADDFLQEPPEYRLSRTTEEEENEPDMQAGSA